MLKDLCFEIIKKCPNNCMFCSSCSSYEEEQIIDYETFKKVIDHLYEKNGIEEISLSGGEPFLHPDLFKMVSYCKNKNIRTVLFTSGIKRNIRLSKEEMLKKENEIDLKYKKYLKEGMSLEECNKLIQKEKSIYGAYNDKEFSSISKEEFEYLKYLGLDKIVFDFQACNCKVYDEIMGTKNEWTLIASSLIRATFSGLETDIHFIPTKINYKELPDLIEIANIGEVNNLSILNFVPQGRGEINKELLQLNYEEFNEFINIYNSCKESFNGKIRIGIPLIGNDTHLCTAGLSKMVIKYDGTVLPCPAFKEMDKESLEKNGVRVLNIYDDLENIRVYKGTRNKPLCKTLYSFNRNLK